MSNLLSTLDALNDSTLRLTYGPIQLEVLQAHHKDALYAAAQDERIWQFTLSSAFGDKFNDWFERALLMKKNHAQLPFVICNIENNPTQIIGSTRFYQIDAAHRSLMIGYTWLLPAFWGTITNNICKYLLLDYAFETLGINRIEFLTDQRNERSRQAILKLGAVEEGILREHLMTHEGNFRNSLIFSILKSEWPPIKTKLRTKIDLALGR